MTIRLSTDFPVITLVCVGDVRTQKYDSNMTNIIFKDNTLQKMATDNKTRSTVIQSPFQYKLTLVPLKATTSPFNLYITNYTYPVRHQLIYLESNIILS